jgi:hypothetical protein
VAFGLVRASPSAVALGTANRGALIAAHAKKGKKPVPEPVVEEEEEEDEDEAVDEDVDEAVGKEDETSDEVGGDSVEAEEEESEAAREQRDASELVPATREKSSKKSRVAKTTVVEDEPSAFSTAVGVARDAVTNPAVRNAGFLIASILAGSFALSAYNVYMRYNSNKSKRKRQVNKNVVVVERLRDFFPENRDSLNKGHIRGLQGKTGFKPEEIFRKYARYKLNEEPFTVNFVADVLALKSACDLDGDTMASVLLETGERIVKKYGILMRDVSEMGQSGVRRKIDGCSMFAKVMYLCDLEEFVPVEKGRETQLKLKEIFGATDEDYEKLKITALGSGEDDVSVLEAMITEKSGKSGGGAEGDDE